MSRIWKEEWKTFKDVFDQFSERNLYKLISNRTIDGLDAPVSIGKEANIFTAKKGGESVIVKMYRLSTCDFNRMYDYLKLDPRFHVKPSKRQVIFAWAKREFRNLLLARESGVSVPVAHCVLYNILIMDGIFSGNALAQKLIHEQLKNPKKFFDELVGELVKMRAANIVHADLSPFNILVSDQHPVMIDWSAATTKENPNYEEYWQRDVKNVCAFFRKIGVNADDKNILAMLK
ncbi:MAG: serine protein kinase RIO [Candidatus Aenigmarchaeota archaeon]|nr:serine protein kinase RIO [Candidatus Aenigmarchaeota archaeon]